MSHSKQLPTPGFKEKSRDRGLCKQVRVIRSRAKNTNLMATKKIVSYLHRITNYMLRILTGKRIHITVLPAEICGGQANSNVNNRTALKVRDGNTPVYIWSCNQKSISLSSAKVK